MTNLKEGDKVQWTHCGSSGRTFSMSLRQGTLVGVEGSVGIVQLKSKKLVRVSLSQLQLDGARSALDVVVESIREAGKK